MYSDNLLSDKYILERCIRQGCPLSPPTELLAERINQVPVVTSYPV